MLVSFLNKHIQFQMLTKMTGICFIQHFITIFNAEVGTSFVPVNNGNGSFWESTCGSVYLPSG